MDKLAEIVIYDRSALQYGRMRSVILQLVPPDCPQQNKWSPWTVYGSTSGPPRLFVVAVSGPPLLHVVPHLYVLLHHRLHYFVSHLEHEQSLLSSSVWHQLHT